MTHATVDRADLEREIKDLLDANFGEVEIVAVRIEKTLAMPDEDEAEIELTVVYRGTTDQLVANRPDELFKMVADKLSVLRRDAFPIFHFIGGDVAR